MSDYSLKYLQELAYFYGGKCLSKEFISNNTKLSWMCSKGHSWDAYLSIVQQGGWCPQCYILDKKKEKKQIYLERCQNAAKERGGKCLSEEYIDTKTKLLWQCSKEHIWPALATSILTNKNWCFICAGKQKKTIEQMQELAEKKGGKCLSEEYVNSYFKLQWQCSKGHKWKATPNGVLNGCWCPHCAGTAKLTIEKMHEIASSKGGKFISKEYINSSTKHKWQCDKGHIWEALPRDIISKKVWCYHCGGTARRTIEDMHEAAKKRGGKFLSMVYTNSHKKHKWQCAEGHIWETTPDGVLNSNTWCPKCSGKEKYTIEQMYELAEKRGGKCLSEAYFNSNSKLLWQCEAGHKWEARPNNLINGKSWCPKCVGKAKLTIEEMHEAAKKRGGKCLSEKYINSVTKLLWQCSEGHKWKAAGINVLRKNSWCMVCTGKVKGTIKEMQRIAKKKGGKCLSDVYVNTKTKLLWECAKGHKWETSPSVIINGKAWCPNCAGKAKHTIEEMKNLAAKKGGKCLSEVYVNTKTKLLWECAKGHKWETLPTVVINDRSWCPVCVGQVKHTIDEMCKFAETKNGKCLSEVYISNSKKLLWQCKEGHNWEATPINVTHNNSWCPECYKKRKKEYYFKKEKEL